MPMYTYECECGKEFVELKTIAERETAQCECGKVAKQILARGPAVIPFQLGWFDHIAPDPVYIRSKKELREVTNRYECYATGFE